MNIFYLDKCPEKAARLQYNKHVVKMILESAQMLCAAHHVYGSTEQKENWLTKIIRQQYGLELITVIICGYIGT
jgi:lipopolysaccharide biosynthesis regulator YciM